MTKKSKIGDKCADLIARYSGTWRAVIHSTVIGCAYILYNTINSHGFDPYPYQLFNLIISVLSFYVPLLVLMSQNRSSVMDKKRDDAIYRLEQNTNAEIKIVEKKIDMILEKLKVS